MWRRCTTVLRNRLGFMKTEDNKETIYDKIYKNVLKFEKKVLSTVIGYCILDEE